SNERQHTDREQGKTGYRQRTRKDSIQTENNERQHTDREQGKTAYRQRTRKD
ncbi:unnamed protein product, partial [Candidula unifasciata]